MSILIHLPNTKLTIFFLITALNHQSNEPTSQREYLHSEYKSASLDKLFEIGNSNSSFTDQAVLILKQEPGPSISNTDTKSPVDPYDIIQIIQIDRNSKGQIYTACDLNTSLHLAVSHKVAEEIVHRIKFFFGNDGPEFIRITSQEISSEDDYGIFVINHSPGQTNSQNNNKIRTIKNLFEDVCQKGLFGKTNFSERSRSNKKNGDADGAHGNSPVLHFGYTTSDCRKNPANRTSTVGSIGPSEISSGIEGLSAGCRKALLKLISTAEKMCPEGPFNIPEGNVYRKEYRHELNKAFGVNFDEDGNLIGEHIITCEGFTIIIPLVLSAHRDFLNDFINGKFFFLINNRQLHQISNHL